MKRCLAFLILIHYPCFLYGQNLQVFAIRYLAYNTGKEIGMVSLLDIYVVNEHPDSLAVPNVEAMGIDSAKYFRLDAEYRKRMLNATGISESDTLFIYDYANNALFAFPVIALSAVACLNDYGGSDDWVFSQREYMIGFELDSLHFKNPGMHYHTSLVCFGKTNPFVKGRMKPVVWKNTKHKAIPIGAKASGDRPWLKKMAIGNTYSYKTARHLYLVQDLIQMGIVDGRHLMVLDRKSGKTVSERIFHDSEGTSLAPLNYVSRGDGKMLEQWTGKLFKNKPPVLFGFLYLSFGCPGITFLDNSESDLYIGCDNRH